MLSNLHCCNYAFNFSLSPSVDLIMKFESFSNKANRCSKI